MWTESKKKIVPTVGLPLICWGKFKLQSIIKAFLQPSIHLEPCQEDSLPPPAGSFEPLQVTSLRWRLRLATEQMGITMMTWATMAAALKQWSPCAVLSAVSIDGVTLEWHQAWHEVMALTRSCQAGLMRRLPDDTKQRLPFVRVCVCPQVCAQQPVTNLRWQPSVAS